MVFIDINADPQKVCCSPGLPQNQPEGTLTGFSQGDCERGANPRQKMKISAFKDEVSVVANGQKVLCEFRLGNPFLSAWLELEANYHRFWGLC